MRLAVAKHSATTGAAFLSRGKQPHEFDRQVLPLGPKGPILKVDLEPHAVDIQNMILSGDFIK